MKRICEGRKLKSIDEIKQDFEEQKLEGETIIIGDLFHKQMIELDDYVTKQGYLLKYEQSIFNGRGNFYCDCEDHLDVFIKKQD